MNRDLFQKELLDWFEKEQRMLPWRINKDPYRIWVSEIMLQQTRVDTVIPYFERFMEWFPTLNDFAEAEEEKILKAWEGLGYYSRVRNLQTAVREVKEKYGGKVPNEPKAIQSLKGVGPYTAGAILSIAYGVPEPAVDGNVMRVLSRILEIEEDIAKPSTRKIFEVAVRELISHEDPSAFNQALMELGALICIPRNPSCLLCPVQAYCLAFANGRQRELPVKTRVKNSKTVFLVTAVLRSTDGKLLIRKRPDQGLLAGLWEFPSFEVESRANQSERAGTDLIQTYFRTNQVEMTSLGAITHVFSHLVWEIQAFQVRVSQADIHLVEGESMKWITEQELSEYALPVPHQKVYELLVYNEEIIDNR